MEKDLKIMLEIYRAIYEKLGVNFDEFSTKKEMWFLEYHMPNEQQEEIMDSIL